MLPTQLFPGYVARAVVVYSSQATATAALCCGRVQCDGYSNERGAPKLPVCRHENTHTHTQKKKDDSKEGNQRNRRHRGLSDSQRSFSALRYKRAFHCCLRSVLARGRSCARLFFRWPQRFPVVVARSPTLSLARSPQIYRASI